MENIKEMLKNKKILTGAIAGLAVVIILIIVIAVSCSKKDDAGKGASKTEAAATTVKKAEKDTADEQNTTEPDTELSEEETTEGSTEVAETETTEQPTTEIAENTTTNVNIQTEPVTEKQTEAPEINIKAEVPSTEAQTPAPEEPATERTTEVATLAGCGNRECSNIIYLGDEININFDTPSEADVCPYKLYDLNNLQTRKYTNGNGYYVTFVGYYGLHCYSDYDGSIMELEYNYATDIVKSYGYGSLEEFEAVAEKLKTNTAATSAIGVGFYKNIPSTINVEEASRADYWASLGQEYDYEIEYGEIDFYGLYMLEY